MIQRAVEAAGIRTVSVMHLKKTGKKSRVPRMMHLRFPLGRAFGTANNPQLQKSILMDLLEFSISGGNEEIKVLDYQWKDYQ